jgi:uncharacterized DUF497 family protein
MVSSSRKLSRHSLTPLAIAVQDLVHGERLVLIGRSGKQRLLLVVYAEIDDDLIRIISARKPTTHERRRYEEGT